MLTDELQALRHSDRVGENLHHFAVVLVPADIHKFPGITDQILNRRINPLRLHWQIHFINEPVNMQTDRAFDRILNRNYTVIGRTACRREKNVGNQLVMYYSDRLITKQMQQRFVRYGALRQYRY
ncbi:hypothetical protein D3C79_866030 [compost metagenome]